MFDPSLSLSGNISRGKTEGYSYNNTTIDAGNKLYINIENGTIKGANISGNDVDVNVKGNLEIASLQDYEEISQRSIGGTVGNVTGNARSYSGQIGVTNGTKNWIEEQTSIIGRNSIRVDVGNKLTLTGSKISNEENGIDKGNLEVRAKEIDSRDIEGYDDLMSVNVEGTVSRKDIYHNQKNGKEAYEKYENDGAITVEGHEREQIARATIGNGTVGLIPTSGMHGGLIEQIPKLILEDEQEVYKLVVIIKNGESSYELKEVSRLDSKELLKAGEKVKVFNNGMNETLEKAAMNTAKQYAYGHGDGVYEMALIYNPTRGFVADALETGLGKVFDGKNAPSLGVSRGLETALRTNDPNQDYELRSYSQGNIISKGALNNMARTNDTSLKNFDLSHTATPIMDKTFAEGSYLQSHLGYTNLGSIGNLYDGVTSEKTGMFFGKATAGLASEMIDVNYDPDKFDSEREALLNGTKGHYTHEFTKKILGLGEAMGNIEQTPMLKAPLFLSKEDSKSEIYVKEGGYVFIDNEDIKKIYQKQYPNDTKTDNVDKMRKILDKEFSRHRIYFDGDFEYKNRLDELEQAKNEALGVEDKEKGRKAYRDLIEKQKEVNIQRQNNIIDILKTQRIPRADYDKDLVEQRNNVLKEELKNTEPRNSSLKTNETEIQNLEIKNDTLPTNRNINDIIQKLRERGGN